MAWIRRHDGGGSSDLCSSIRSWCPGLRVFLDTIGRRDCFSTRCLVCAAEIGHEYLDVVTAAGARLHFLSTQETGCNIGINPTRGDAGGAIVVLLSDTRVRMIEQGAGKVGHAHAMGSRG